MATVTHHRRLLGALAGLALLAMLLAGCGLFEPTSPEIGDTGEVLITDYSTPEKCLEYMAIGIGRKDNIGLDAYIGALADSSTDGVGFHATFDAAVWNAYSGIKPDDWNLGRERTQFYPAFAALRSERYRMEWVTDSIHSIDEEPDPTHKILHRQYRVWALGETDSLLIAVGFADLYFASISSSRWALTRWDDRVAPYVGVNPANEMWRTFGHWRLNLSTGG
jgi:hypothetical protein